jgi:hypothetical protein
MKIFNILLVMLLTGCATEQPMIYARYYVPGHWVNVCNHARLRIESPDIAIRGRCYPYRVPPEIYCEPSVNDKLWVNPFTYTHEAKHLIPEFGLNYHK